RDMRLFMAIDDAPRRHQRRQSKRIGGRAGGDRKDRDLVLEDLGETALDARADRVRAIRLLSTEIGPRQRGEDLGRDAGYVVAGEIHYRLVLSWRARSGRRVWPQFHRSPACPGTEVEDDDLLSAIRQPEANDKPLAGRLQRFDDGTRRQVEDRVVGRALWGDSARLGTMLRADYDRADQREGAADEQPAEDDHQQPKGPHRSWSARASTTGNELNGKAIPAATRASGHSVTSLAADAGERLDRVLAAHLGDLSRSRLKHLILEGSVTREGATISDPAMRVKPGQTFDVAIPEAVADRPLAQTMDLDIRYEDDHLLVIDKPAGLVVHPAPGNPDRTLVNALLAHCGD